MLPPTLARVRTRSSFHFRRKTTPVVAGFPVGNTRASRQHVPIASRATIEQVKFAANAEICCRIDESAFQARRASERSASTYSESSLSEASDRPVFEFEGDDESVFKELDELPGSDQPGFGSSGYAIAGCDNGRILALAHAKGNMLYALGDNAAAAKAFEDAVLIGSGPHSNGIDGLIKRILAVVGYDAAERSPGGRRVPPSSDPILLPPDAATRTAQLCFPPHGQLPGLKHVSGEGLARKAAISTMSNSLLSLAKIFQDGMATNSPKTPIYQSHYSVREILALYTPDLEFATSTINKAVCSSTKGCFCKTFLVHSLDDGSSNKYSETAPTTARSPLHLSFLHLWTN